MCRAVRKKCSRILRVFACLASLSRVLVLGYASEQFGPAGGNLAQNPQGEGSGDEGVMGTIEPRFYTNVPGLVVSTYLDLGHVWYRKDGGLDSASNGQPSSGETLKGWGVGIAYTKTDDWFARLDYARRIGDDPNISQAAKARGRTWFILGKLW